MSFIHHNFLGDLELNKKETNGIRLYNLPDGQWVPSITSVTSFYNRQIFVKWRQRVGIEEANRITKKATTRGTLYSEYLGLAGRVDCIAEYEGELAVIDFKTSEKIKPEKWLENYFVQEMFYASAYYELTGIPVKKLITLMVTPGGDVKVFDKRNKGDYIKLLVRYIKEFVHHNTGSENGE